MDSALITVYCQMIGVIQFVNIYLLKEPVAYKYCEIHGHYNLILTAANMSWE